MEEKWFNSSMANRIGIGAIILALGIGGASFMKGCQLGPSANEVEIEQLRGQYKLQIADLNGNGIPEKFYIIEGKIAVTEIDGKPISDYIKK